MILRWYSRLLVRFIKLELDASTDAGLTVLVRVVAKRHGVYQGLIMSLVLLL